MLIEAFFMIRYHLQSACCRFCVQNTRKNRKSLRMRFAVVRSAATSMIPSLPTNLPIFVDRPKENAQNISSMFQEFFLVKMRVFRSLVAKFS